MSNTSKTLEGQVLNWRVVKWLRFEKEKPNLLQFKNEYWDESFQIVDTTRRGRKLSKGSKLEPKALYDAKFKSQNLHEMCNGKDAVISTEYHNFYNSLPVVDATNKNVTEDSEDEISLQAIKAYSKESYEKISKWKV